MGNINCEVNIIRRKIGEKKCENSFSWFFSKVNTFLNGFIKCLEKLQKKEKTTLLVEKSR